MNAEAAVAVAVRALVIDGATPAGLLTVSVNVAEPLPVALVAVMVMVLVPATVGVPLITPVVVFTVKPAGSPVALKLVGFWLPVIW